MDCWSIQQRKWTVEVFSRGSGLLNYSADESELFEYSAEERLQASVPNYAFRRLHDEI